METILAISSGPLNWNFQINPLSIGTIVAFLIIIALLISSALVSGSEVAYFSLSPKDIMLLRKSKTKTATTALKNLEDPENLLATILVANNFVNIGIIILSAYVTSNLFVFSNMPLLEFLVQVVIITAFLVLFGEIVPKVYAANSCIAFAKFMALPLSFLGKVSKPINFLLVYSTSFVNRRLKKHNKNISMDEISQALELTSDKELSDEKEMLEGIVKFGDKTVEDIMRPRVDVVAINAKTSFKEVIKTINESGFSRIPVFSGSFDQVNGILYIKDLLPHAHKGNTFKWQSIIRPPFYVPVTKKINALLEEFRNRKVHMAIVVDEYGGSSGIVTLEDVLEEIVGEINDEFDEEERLYSKMADGSFLFNGKTPLPDFYRILECNDTIFDDVKGDADTLAGLILELKGEIPALHEKVSCKNFLFTIEGVNNRRIEQISVETQ